MTGAIFGFLYWKFGMGMELAIILVYASLLVSIFVIDLEHQLILNVVVYPAMPVALALSLFWPALTPANALLGGAVGVGLVSIPFLSPNPPKDTDGRREDSGRVGEGAIGEMAGLHWGRLEVGGRSSVAA